MHRPDLAQYIHRVKYCVNDNKISLSYNRYLSGLFFCGVRVIMKPIISTMAVAAGLFAGVSVYAQHHAHVHGVGELNVAVEGGRLLIEFQSPMHNLVGFEHAPQNQAQAQALADMQRKLEEEVAAVFMPTPAAGCQVESVELESGLFDAGDVVEAHDLSTGGGMEMSHHSHTDLEAQFVFSCSKPDELRSLDVGLFDLFDGFETLNVQLVTPKMQSAATLDADHSQIVW